MKIVLMRPRVNKPLLRGVFSLYAHAWRVLLPLMDECCALDWVKVGLELRVVTAIIVKTNMK